MSTVLINYILINFAFMYSYPLCQDNYSETVHVKVIFFLKTLICYYICLM